MPAAYESTEELNSYLQFHYGAAPERFPAPFGMDRFQEFHSRVLRRLLAPVPAETSGARALDLGCGVGRVAFELSRSFPEVIGVDFPASFIAAAERLRPTGAVPYESPPLGAERLPAMAAIPPGARPER